MLEPKVSHHKGDRNKIYFLIIVILSLIGTNAYLYIKDKNENERFITANTEKDRLKLEVEKIEVELEKVSTLNATLTDKLLEEQKLARTKITELKAALHRSVFTQGELINAQDEVKELREFVKNLNEETAKLHDENELLKTQRDSLQVSVNTINEKAKVLEKKNVVLSNKVKESAALKANTIVVTSYRVRNNGKQSEVKNASQAKKLEIKFGIIPNSLAKENYQKIYLRVFDPAGNLVANENNMFYANNQQMQYSEMTVITYQQNIEFYELTWVNPKIFMKGTYKIILYANGSTMGVSSITIK